MNLVGIQTKYISPFMITGLKLGKEKEERDKIIMN